MDTILLTLFYSLTSAILMVLVICNTVTNRKIKALLQDEIRLTNELNMIAKHLGRLRLNEYVCKAPSRTVSKSNMQVILHSKVREADLSPN